MEKKKPSNLHNHPIPKLLSDHLKSTLFHLLKLSILIAFFTIQIFFILQSSEPFYSLLPLYSLSLLLILLYKSLLSPPPFYLVDFSCFNPPDSCSVPFSKFFEHARKIDFLDKETIDFMSKVLTKSGQGQRTYLPPAIHHIPPKSSHEEAINEAEMVLFPVFQDLLSKTNLSPIDIDILIVNCSGFCPSPSLSSIVVNRFSMREDVKSFNISGMGCSASALSIDLAYNLMKTHRNSYAVVLSTESLSTGWYSGKYKPMIVLNCLFRMGATAILVTNRRDAGIRSKYKLIRSLRTQRAFDDRAYLSAIREEDSKGLTGVNLRKDLLQVAGQTLRSNIEILGSSILPTKEKLKYGMSMIRKKFIHKSTEIRAPDFKSAVQHFCLPVSGKPVIREIGKGLGIGEREMEPATATLHRFGNQSSSAVWYELAYLEAKQRVKQGERVWQLGMGSGPKCNSLVWECVRPMVGEAQIGPWADSIDSYPDIMDVNQSK